MREIENKGVEKAATVTCEVCGRSFTPKKPATACGGRCRAIRSREARRAEAVRRIRVAEEGLRAVRELLEHAPEGILAVPIVGGRS
jgi:hypothetical protein